MLDFLCIGAQKAGTSWLHAHLERHPQVAFPHGKEVHYWDWVQSGKRPDDIAWYRRKFSSSDHDGRLCGDMTPAYALLDTRWIEQVRVEYPDCRILYILRNPIDRAWSAARMVFDFSQLEIDEVDDDWFLRLLRSRSSLARGAYEINLRRWREHFPPEQTRVMFYDDLLADRREFLCEVARYLKIDSRPFQDLSEDALTRRYQWGRCLPITPRLHQELRNVYAEQILSLGRYLDRDLTHWLE